MQYYFLFGQRSVFVRVSYLARVRSAAVTPPSATAFTWATAALITWRDRQRTRVTTRHFTVSWFILKKEKGWTVCADNQTPVMTVGHSHHQQLHPVRWCRPQTDQSQSSLHWKHWPVQRKKKKKWKKCFTGTVAIMIYIFHIFWFSMLQEPQHIASSPMLNQSRPVVQVYITNWQPLTSKGSAVALATPWTSLLVVHEPLLTCGPAPSTCCRTLKARASLVPAAADSLTTAEWAKLPALARRMSPGRGRTEMRQGGVHGLLLG